MGGETGAILSVLALAAGVTVVGGTTGAVLWSRRARRRGSFDDDLAYYEHYANLADSVLNHEAALAWLAPARDLAPQDAGIAMREMFSLYYAGQTRGAIVAGSRWADLAPRDDGAADYYIAALYAMFPGQADQAQARMHLERALARQPTLAATIQRDPLFEAHHDEDFQRMLDEAFDRTDS
jgi:hypothetical protein